MGCVSISHDESYEISVNSIKYASAKLCKKRPKTNWLKNSKRWKQYNVIKCAMRGYFDRTICSNINRKIHINPDNEQT